MKIIVFLILLFAVFSVSGCGYDSQYLTSHGNPLNSSQADKLNGIMFAYLGIAKAVKLVAPTADLRAGDDFYQPSAVIKTVGAGSKPAIKKIIEITGKNTNRKYVFKPPKLKYANIKHRAKIIGTVNGLPVLTVNFKNKPLWNILQDISNQTDYVFSSQGINLAKNYSINGRFNLAELLSKIFANDKTTVNMSNKRVKIWR